MGLGLLSTGYSEKYLSSSSMDEYCGSFTLDNNMKNFDFCSSVRTNQITESIYRFKIKLQIQNQFTDSKSSYRFKINLQFKISGRGSWAGVNLSCTINCVNDDCVQ